MAYLRIQGNRRHVLLAVFLGMGLFGCSPRPEPGTGRQLSAVLVEPHAAAAPSETVTFSLALEPGGRTRYQVTTEAVTALEGEQAALQNDPLTSLLPKVFESSEVVFTQEILGPVPGDADRVAALVTIEQVRHVRTCPGQAAWAFDGRKPADRNSPFAKLVGQSYTIEIHPLGYVTGVFNLRSARRAVQGDTAAHAAALNLVDPPAIFLRHGSFSLPGPDVGSLAAGGRWRGVQQFTLDPSGTDLGRLGTHRFEKIYRLERVKPRPAGTVAAVSFVGTPIPRTPPDGRPAEVPFLSCSYAGGGEFNLDTGRVENYLEHLEVRMPVPQTVSPPAAGPDGRILIATRACRVQRLDLE